DENQCAGETKTSAEECEKVDRRRPIDPAPADWRVLSMQIRSHARQGVRMRGKNQESPRSPATLPSSAGGTEFAKWLELDCKTLRLLESFRSAVEKQRLL